MNNLLEFWPEKTEVETFCVQQAEVAHESVTLSVHQELSFQRIKEGGSGSKQKASENDLLDAVLTPSTELTDGFKFIVISGYAGVGKSHYISWINSQLKRSEDANNFHVVWVRKYDTLRTILQSILKPFLDLPEFSRILDDLDQAILNNQNNAGYAFQAGMNLALDNEILSITKELESISGKSEYTEKIKVKKAEQGFLASLKSIFNEPDLLNHWTNEESGVFSRILNQVIQGKNFDNVEDEEHLFHVADLTSAFNDVVLDQLNRRVAIFYQSKLDGTDAEKNLTKSVDLLNSLVDKATNFAFQFNQNMGGKSFRDLLNEIRGKLFKQNKELVFLIEDFQAMAGLQDELLPTFIFGGSEEEQICKIRTVLAVTEDFFVSRSTTMSHRKDEFVIERRVSNEEEQINSALDMVGAYLNATRLGVNKLKGTLNTDVGSELNADWPPSFQSDGLSNVEQKALDAFDKSPTRGYSLFPFNKHFIIEFLKTNDAIDGSLTFSARGIVRNLLLENLSTYRPDFQSGSFPTKAMAPVGSPLDANLENRIQNLSGNQDQKARFKALVKKWANGNQEVSCGANFSEVANAFGLKSVWDEYAAGEPLRPPTDPKPKKDRPDPVEQKPEQGWRDISPKKRESINAWGNVNLNQQDAREFRTHVVDHLNAAFDFTDFLKRVGGKIDLKVGDIKIPNAQGNTPNAYVDVGDDEGARLRLVYMAFERSKLNKTDSQILFDYPKGLEDRAEIAEFIEPLKDQIIEKAKAQNLSDANHAAAIVSLIKPMIATGSNGVQLGNGDDLLKESDTYRVLNDWLKKKDKLISNWEDIRKQHDQVAFVFQGEGRGGNPLCRNPNYLSSIHNLLDDFTEEFQEKHYRFFGDFIAPKQFSKEVDRCLEAQKNLVFEICSFFEGTDFNFGSDRENFTKFLEAIETRWPGREYNKSVLLAFFDFLDGLAVNNLISWNEKVLSPSADLPTKIIHTTDIEISELIRWHLAVTKLSDFFEAVESKLPSTTGPSDASLYDAQQGVAEALAAINRALEGVE